MVKALSLMKEKGDEPVLKIKILSNIIVHQFCDILDYYLRSSGIACDISVGNYDNIIQDSSGIHKDEIVIIFWEAANTIDGFHYLANTMAGGALPGYSKKVRDEMRWVFDSLRFQKKVFMNVFHAMPFDDMIRLSPYELFVKDLNKWLYANQPDNFMLVDLTKIFARHGIEKLFDLRNFFSSKSLYSVEFYKLYSQRVIPMIKALTGRVKKVLVVDCDNTLWQGIVGEDGKDGIRISQPYRVVQSNIVELNSQGILICLCSKNNPGDVEDVLQNHPDMILGEEHIIIKKVNWTDKASNICSIAEELNLGLSSFVFLDDSPFEVNLVREQLPEVTALQVPGKLREYPLLAGKLHDLFFRFESSLEDGKKTRQYREQLSRESFKKTFSSVEDYLKSLEINLTIEKNKKALLARMAQMTQKTNQFNLTTIRYSEQDVENMLDSENVDIFTLSVKDKFGDSGVTGLAIFKTIGEYNEIDTLLLSCRILGRNIELVFINELIKTVEKPLIKSRYVPTPKNMQVCEFYEQVGFRLLTTQNGIKEYELRKSEYIYPNPIDYIKLANGREN